MLGKSSEDFSHVRGWTVTLGGSGQSSCPPTSLPTRSISLDRLDDQVEFVCKTSAHMNACTDVCWARKWHVLGRACREALGWIPTLIWLWLHPSFPSRPGEAKLHRWPSGWHFRTRPSAPLQPSPAPTLFCFSGSINSAKQLLGQDREVLGGGWQGAQAQG